MNLNSPTIGKSLLLLALASLPATALADGGFLVDPYYEIYETGQVAFIRYDSANGVEDLHILPEFEGNARNFAWIVPVPSLPTLAESSTQLFYDCARLASPVYRYRESSWGCEGSSIAYDTVAENGVDVLESQTVGDYDTMILGADDAAVLTDSLTAWGFLHEDNQAAALAVLEGYVADGWYFVTLKIDSTAFDGWPRAVRSDRSEPYYPYYGWIDPIRITFASESIVYPMRISALSASALSEVVLYVAADHRMEFPGARIGYANRIGGDELRAIRESYRSLGVLIGEGDYLTRLDRIFSPAEMDEDLLLTASANDAEIHQIRYSRIPLGLLLLLLGAAGLRLLPRRKKAVAPGGA